VVSITTTRSGRYILSSHIPGLVAGCDYQIRISSVLRFHIVPPVQCVSAARSDLAAMGFLASFTSWAYRIAKLLINSGLRS